MCALGIIKEASNAANTAAAGFSAVWYLATAPTLAVARYVTSPSRVRSDAETAVRAVLVVAAIAAFPVVLAAHVGAARASDALEAGAASAAESIGALA